MPQAIVILFSLILFLLALKPVALIVMYFVLRPLVHPFAVEQLKLFGLPINWPFSVVIVAGLAAVAVTKKRFALFPPNSIPLYLLLALSLISCAFSISLSASVSQSIKYLNALSLYLLVITAASSRDSIVSILRGISLSSIIPMVFGYYQYLVGTGHLVRGEHTDRIASFFLFANLYGIFLALTLFVTLMLYFQESNRLWKRIYAAITLSAVVSTILALNRGTWIAMVLGLIVSFFFYRRYLSFKWLITAVVLVTIAGAGTIVQRFMQLEEPSFSGNTFEARMAMAEAIIGSASDVPVLGYGSGTAQLVLDMKFGAENVPHNDYLRLFIEMGFLAPLLYFVFIAREFLANSRRRLDAGSWHINYFSMAAIIYFAVISSVQNVVHDAVVFPLFLSLCALTRQYGRVKQL